MKNRIKVAYSTYKCMKLRAKQNELNQHLLAPDFVF